MYKLSNKMICQYFFIYFNSYFYQKLIKLFNEHYLFHEMHEKVKLRKQTKRMQTRSVTKKMLRKVFKVSKQIRQDKCIQILRTFKLY